MSICSPSRTRDAAWLTSQAAHSLHVEGSVWAVRLAGLAQGCCGAKKPQP